MPQYSSWEQVAGYFDGDGTIALSDTTNQPYKLSLSLIFVDQSWDQIVNVKQFLQSRGIRTGNVLTASKANAYQVAISEFTAVRETLKGMLPFLCKKAREARGAFDYYDNKITGSELFDIFVREVEAGRRGRRSRKIPIEVPYLRQEGD